MEVFVLVAMLSFVSVLNLDVEEKSKVYVEVALDKTACEGALGISWKTPSSTPNGLNLRYSQRVTLGRHGKPDRRERAVFLDVSDLLRCVAVPGTF